MQFGQRRYQGKKKSEDYTTKEFIESLLRAIPVPVFFKDKEGRYIGCNQAFSEVMGVTSEQIRGKTVYELWPGELARIYHQKDLELMEKREHQVYEFQVRDKNGQIRPVIFAKDVFLDPQGQIAGMVGAFVDISERKKVELALQESENLFRKMNENSPLGMHFYRLDGNDDLIFVDSNPAADQLLGLANAQFRGQPIETAFPQLAQTEVPDRYRAAAAMGIPWASEQVTYQDEKIVGAFEVRAFQTTPRNMVAVFANITARKQAEEALRKSEEHNRAIVAALPDLLFQINTNLQFTDCRANTPDLLLAPPEQVIGQGIEQVLPAELAELTIQYVRQTLVEGGVQVYRYALNIAGLERYFEARMTLSGPESVLVLARDISSQKQAEDALKKASCDLEEAYDATLLGWSSALELREHETAGHSRRVVKMTLRLAKACQVPPEHLIHIQRGALLHDIGKMGIPDSILLKPGPLDEREWAVMRQHPQFAQRMLAGIPYLLPALDIPYCHHEKWDGSGYPRGLQGEQIPLSARLFAIVDVWDALRSDRPYRQAWGEEQVLEHIHSLNNTHFDPKAVEIFMQSLKK